MNVQELAEQMKTRVAGKPGLGGTVKFDLGSDGCVYLDGTGAQNAVTANKNDPASCTIKMSASDFSDLIHGRIQGTTAFAQGKIKVDGDTGVAMKLSGLV